jgi:hypothetical protein
VSIEVRHISKSFGAFRALDDVSVSGEARGMAYSGSRACGGDSAFEHNYMLGGVSRGG